MALGVAIVANADAKGRWCEGVLSGTPSPGTFMEILPATNPVSGRYSFRARSSAGGSADAVLIMVNNWEGGQINTTAGTSGDRVKLYWPLPGDELNALVAESAGTGTSGENLIGDRLAINSSGLLYAGGSLTQRPFWLIDRTGLSATATSLRLVWYIGHAA